MPRILLIGDDDSVRTTLHEMLGRRGHTVIEARDGTAGLALFDPAAIDLAITDIVMADIDELELIQALRRTHPPVKIIALSGTGGGNELSPDGHLPRGGERSRQTALPRGGDGGDQRLLPSDTEGGIGTRPGYLTNHCQS
jgi:CheY-like chemotaxis protein